MSVLDSIIEGVREDLAARRTSLGELQEKIDRALPPLDSYSQLKGQDVRVIAEVKRSSPSKGELATIADPASLALSYQEGGASVISVLTEKRRFGGSLDDLDRVREKVHIPILRKDFMIDEYQFFEARAHGADLVLLIVAALSKSQLKDFYDLSTELGMAALIEVHTAGELESAMEISPRAIGVNARNLKTLSVDTAAFAELLPRIPGDLVRIAESGIVTRGDVQIATESGADAILVGETLVKTDEPGRVIRELIGRE